MSRKPYECFRCRDNGYPDTMVYLAGKDGQGKTVYVEEDGTPHQHKPNKGTGMRNISLTDQPQEQSKQTEYERSVDNGISAFSMMTDLIRLVEQTQKLLVTMDGKLDRLTNLVYAQQQEQK